MKTTDFILRYYARLLSFFCKIKHETKSILTRSGSEAKTFLSKEMLKLNLSSAVDF